MPHFYCKGTFFVQQLFVFSTKQINFAPVKSKEMAKKSFHNALIFFALCLAYTSCQTQRLSTADLLFHVTPQSNAITDVTPGMIDHVAIVLHTDSVIEAVGRGVVITPIDSLRQQPGYYLVGRVKGVHRPASIAHARTYLGRPYDYLYLSDNEAIYCSELVQFSFVDKQGRRLFTPIPMSFHDATGQITDYWLNFYKERGMDVPEGQPGTNPGELSQRPQIRIVGRL